MKSPLLSALRRAFALVETSEKHPGISLEELYHESRALRLQRRQFLKTSLQAGLLMGLGGPALSGRLFAAAIQPRIAIVGAGLAGLTVGSYLKVRGIPFTLYEADKRVGGRVKSARVFADGSLNTEFGAEFIDTSHKDMFNLIRSLGLQHELWDVETDVFGQRDAFYMENKHRTLAEVTAQLNPVYARIRRDQRRMRRAEHAAALDRLSIAEYVDQLPIDGWVKNMINVAFLGENGREAAEQSALNLLEMMHAKKNTFVPFGDSDERYKVVGGNEQVPRQLAEKLHDHLRFEHRLTALRELANGQIKLTFNNGATVEETFDLVVLSLPFTVLREVQIDMELPPIKRQIIRELSYGTNTKFILETRERPWRQRGFRGYLFNERIPNGWDSSQMQLGNAGPGTFTVYFGGHRGAEARRGTEAEQLAYILPALEGAFPGTQAALTGKQELLHWPGNPFARASYSCFSPGQSTRFAGQAFLPVRNLYFAGEHCSEEFWGFMNGAAETGRRVADAISEKVRRK